MHKLTEEQVPHLIGQAWGAAQSLKLGEGRMVLSMHVVRVAAASEGHVASLQQQQRGDVSDRWTIVPMTQLPGSAVQQSSGGVLPSCMPPCRGQIQS